MKKQIAYLRGCRAYLEGKTSADNPYIRYTQRLVKEWEAGLKDTANSYRNLRQYA